MPAFKPPEARNAATTLAVMSVILGTLFVGITFLANGFGLIPNDEVTIIAQAAEAVFGAGSIGFFLFLTFTTLILMLAANTSFAAFPVLAAVLASDRFFPRAFSFRGERLAYTLGIVVLGVLASILIVAFGGDTGALIPLYAVAIFTDFTISQSGMVRHWLRHRTDGLAAAPGHQRRRRRHHRHHPRLGRPSPRRPSRCWCSWSCRSRWR